MTIELFKKAMETLNQKSEAANTADQYFEEHPFDEAAEEAFDKAYEEEFEAFEKAAESLAELIKIDNKLAQTMIRTQRDRIEELINRLAA